MEKGPSEYARYWTSEFNEVNHFTWHGYDMGFYLITDYSSAAVDFAHSTSETLKSFTAKDGSKCQYDPETNEFMRISKSGKIITYFYPDRELDYFYEQFDRYGDYWN